MSRTLSAAMQTAISAKSGYADVWLLDLVTTATVGATASAILYATAPTDVTWDGRTWVGIGGAIDFTPPPETSDPAAQSLRISLSGVDRSIITAVLDSNLRGRMATLYWGQILLSTGVIVEEPIEVFQGLMNAMWDIEHTPSDEQSAGTVRVSTTIVTEMARRLSRRIVKTNVLSLQQMQKRTTRDIWDNSNPDVFFQTLPALIGQPIYWGRVGASIPPTFVGGAGIE
jgi:hypothetical protein